MQIRMSASIILPVLPLVGCLALTGCGQKTSPEDAKAAGQIVGSWSRPMPKGAFAASEATIEFKANGQYTMKTGNMESQGRWAVKDGRLAIDDAPPQIIRELTSTRLCFDANGTQTILTRLR